MPNGGPRPHTGSLCTQHEGRKTASSAIIPKPQDQGILRGGKKRRTTERERECFRESLFKKKGKASRKPDKESWEVAWSTDEMIKSHLARVVQRRGKGERGQRQREGRGQKSRSRGGGRHTKLGGKKPDDA